MNYIRILGLMTLLSYTAVVIYTWMGANLDGYVYFSAGEPRLLIKYLEWLLGFTGIYVALDSLVKELFEKSGHNNYDVNRKV